MLETAIPTNHYTATLDNGEAISSNVPWRITHLDALPDFQLSVRFIDGTRGRVEMRELIFGERAGVFASLRDPNVFAQVSINPDFGSVEWANGLDIAPDATHEDIHRYGVQVLS